MIMCEIRLARRERAVNMFYRLIEVSNREWSKKLNIYTNKIIISFLFILTYKRRMLLNVLMIRIYLQEIDVNKMDKINP